MPIETTERENQEVRGVEKEGRKVSVSLRRNTRSDLVIVRWEG